MIEALDPIKKVQTNALEKSPAAPIYKRLRKLHCVEWLINLKKI